MGGAVLGEGPKQLPRAQKSTPETQFRGYLMTGVELFQYLNNPPGLTGVYRVIISCACTYQRTQSFTLSFSLSLAVSIQFMGNSTA